MGKQKSTGTKIAITIGVVFLFFIIAIPLQASGAPSLLILLMAFGVFYGLKSLYKEEDEDEDTGLSLDKSSNDVSKPE